MIGRAVKAILPGRVVTPCLLLCFGIVSVVRHLPKLVQSWRVSPLCQSGQGLFHIDR